MMGGMKALFIALLALGLMSGCNKQASRNPNAKKAPSTAETMINGMTGRSAVNAGQKARADITRISEAHNRDLDEITE